MVKADQSSCTANSLAASVLKFPGRLLDGLAFVGRFDGADPFGLGQRQRAPRVPESRLAGIGCRVRCSVRTDGRGSRNGAACGLPNHSAGEPRGEEQIAERDQPPVAGLDTSGADALVPDLGGLLITGTDGVDRRGNPLAHGLLPAHLARPCGWTAGAARRATADENALPEMTEETPRPVPASTPAPARRAVAPATP